MRTQCCLPPRGGHVGWPPGAAPGCPRAAAAGTRGGWAGVARSRGSASGGQVSSDAPECACAAAEGARGGWAGRHGWQRWSGRPPAAAADTRQGGSSGGRASGRDREYVHSYRTCTACAEGKKHDQVEGGGQPRPTPPTHLPAAAAGRPAWAAARGARGRRRPCCCCCCCCARLPHASSRPHLTTHLQQKHGRRQASESDAKPGQARQPRGSCAAELDEAPSSDECSTGEGSRPHTLAPLVPSQLPPLHATLK